MVQTRSHPSCLTDGHTGEPNKEDIERWCTLLNSKSSSRRRVLMSVAVFIMSILMPNLVTGGVCISTLFLAGWGFLGSDQQECLLCSNVHYGCSRSCIKRAAAVTLLHFNTINVFLFFFFALIQRIWCTFAIDYLTNNFWYWSCF